MKKVTPSSFGKKIAKAMKDISSSHVYFIVKQAYGEISWEEVEKIFKMVMNYKTNCLQPCGIS